MFTEEELRIIYFLAACGGALGLIYFAAWAFEKWGKRD